jgi:hypothetical protein
VHNSIKVPAMGVLNPDPHKFWFLDTD